MNNENNKRLAKNTLLLYCRMLLTLGISLFTVRVVLNVLGVVDYGVYNVVGGIVVMFSFISNSMATATQRYFAFELGKNNFIQLKKLFSLTITIYVIIAVLVLLLTETIGLWFLNTQLNIPTDRMEAVNWIYQLSILSFIVTILTIPYNAAIIAHENMKIYAYLGIAEVVLKLASVYILVLFSFDKLKLYAVLMFFITLIVSALYRVICIKKYRECRFNFYWDRNLFGDLMSYSSWNLFGAVAGVINNQGINILLNVFFGPIVNASRAISYQIGGAINLFVSNFVTAFNPQIIKYYAADEKEEMMSLVFKSSKFSYYLLFIISMPILLETNYILTLWLEQIPEYVIIFTRLVIIIALLDSLSFPLMTAAQATGEIKKYQSLVGGMMLLNLPLSYCAMKIGLAPQVTMYIALGIAIICLLLRLTMLKKMIGLPIKKYVKDVLINVVIVSFLSCLIPIWVHFQLDENLARVSIIALIAPVLSFISIYTCGLSMDERNIVNKLINKYTRNR